ncbi:mitochondrial import inner membrane translocase subunit Tim54 [Tuber indicum]|nr:mitochondrial import inner membrane translocase subunit Tim54 [Tuber indicum]
METQPPPPAAPPPPPPPQGNPAFRAMGLPNIRAKFPSRNWSIFISLSTAFAAAVYYDRRETKRVQKHWCSVVEHLAREPLSTLELPRKVTVYLSAPPGDTITPSREYFREYVKPVFTAAALEFDVVEGKKRGEVRWKVAEGIRKVRRRGGEGGRQGEEGEEEEDGIEGIRRRNGVVRVGVQGDVVVGRHTWKEYIRGLHEGWLGPLQDSNATPPPQEFKPPPTSKLDRALAETPDPDKKAREEEDKKKKASIPSPHILPHAYNTSPTPRSLPETFDPVGFIPHAHILGFLNTPIRLYRFLNHRKTADLAGREAAAIALGIYSRPFNLALEPSSTMMTSEDVKGGFGAGREGGEIGRACGREEEAEWPKRVWEEEGTGAGEITEEVVVDYRIGGRMRRFVLPEGAEAVVDAEKGKF